MLPVFSLEFLSVSGRIRLGRKSVDPPAKSEDDRRNQELTWIPCPSSFVLWTSEGHGGARDDKEEGMG